IAGPIVSHFNHFNGFFPSAASKKPLKRLATHRRASLIARLKPGVNEMGQSTFRAKPPTRLIVLVCLLLVIALSLIVSAQQPDEATGVIRLRVRVATGDGTKAKGLARKRFFLIKGSLEDNKDLFQTFQQRPVTSRDCY